MLLSAGSDPDTGLIIGAEVIEDHRCSLDNARTGDNGRSDIPGRFGIGIEFGPTNHQLAIGQSRHGRPITGEADPLTHIGEAAVPSAWMI